MGGFSGEQAIGQLVSSIYLDITNSSISVVNHLEIRV